MSEQEAILEDIRVQLKRIADGLDVAKAWLNAHDGIIPVEIGEPILKLDRHQIDQLISAIKKER